MDIATLVGLVAGIFLVLGTIALGGEYTIFLDLPSALLVLGGTIAATLVNFPLGDVLSVFNTIKKTFVERVTPTEEVIQKLVHYSAIARREGILALERQPDVDEDEFLMRGIELAIDGIAPELIKDILTTEISFLEERHMNGQSIIAAMAQYAPAFGMIGTLIGLVAMLSNLENPSQIGQGMAIALLTTLYGALLANLVLLPVVGKLRTRTSDELLHKAIIMEGILSIQSGDNPRVVEHKLKAFLAPSVRRRVTIERYR